MKSTSQKLEQARIKLMVYVNAQEMSAYLKQALDHLREHISVEGFRPGKAPDGLVIQQIGRARVEAESLDIAINQSYQQVIQTEKIKPIALPKIEVKKFQVIDDNKSSQSDETVLEYEAIIETMPEIELKDYKNLSVKKSTQEPAVTDQEIKKVIERLLKDRAKLTETDRPSQTGDWLEINFQGELNNVPRDELKSDHFPIILGEANLIPGFEDQLVGLKKEEEKVFSIVFPENYPKADLKKQKVKFKIKVLDLKERVLPSLDEEFLKSIGQKTEVELRESIKKSLLIEKNRVENEKLDNEIIEELLKKVKVQAPEVLVEQETDRMINETKEHLSQANLAWQDYLDRLKKTEEELRKEIKPQSEKKVKIGLTFAKIMAEESIDGQDKEAMRKVLEKLRKYVK